MPYLPAVCNDCGTLFRSGIYLENAMNTSIGGGTASPCPKCGGRGTIEGGIFDATAEAITVLQSKSPGELQRLIDRFTAVKDDPVKARQVIEQEAPALAKWLRDPGMVAALLTLLLQIVTMWQTAAAPRPATAEDIAKLIEHTIDHVVDQQPEGEGGGGSLRVEGP